MERLLLTLLRNETYVNYEMDSMLIVPLPPETTGEDLMENDDFKSSYIKNMVEGVNAEFRVTLAEKISQDMVSIRSIVIVAPEVEEDD